MLEFGDEMMDITIETEIIKLFVQKQYQKRLLYEISSKKEYDIIRCHFYTEYKFKKECLEKVSYMGDENLEKYLFQLSGKKDIYFMGINTREKMPLKEAVKRINHFEDGIIYCGNGIGYYQGEEELSDTPRYILKSKDHKTND